MYMRTRQQQAPQPCPRARIIVHCMHASCSPLEGLQHARTHACCIHVQAYRSCPFVYRLASPQQPHPHMHVRFPCLTAPGRPLARPLTRPPACLPPCCGRRPCQARPSPSSCCSTASACAWALPRACCRPAAAPRAAPSWRRQSVSTATWRSTVQHGTICAVQGVSELRSSRLAGRLCRLLLWHPAVASCPCVVVHHGTRLGPSSTLPVLRCLGRAAVAAVARCHPRRIPSSCSRVRRRRGRPGADGRSVLCRH